MTNVKAQMPKRKLKCQSSNAKFDIWIFDFICHLDFDIWISETGAIFR